MSAGGDASPPSSEKRSDARVPFVDRTRVPASAPSPGAAVRPLEGLKYAVKDVFAIEGRVASFGSPAWRATHDPATTAARAVTLCADAGAVGVGVAAADELGFGVTARSSSAPRGAPARRIPGGRSGGGAVAVASRAAGVDFALGTDASGGVRVPAALAGCYGFRPTQGAVSASGVTRHAPSMDTVGWFARDPETLAKVGEALMDKAPRTPTNSELPTSLLVVEDALDAGDTNAACAVGAACGALGERFAKVTRATGEGGISRINLGAHLLKICPSLREVARALSPETEERSAGLAALRECHRLLVAAEAWKEIGPWYRACDAATNAAITPPARELLEACAAIEPESLATIRRAREEARVAVGLLLDGTGAALVFPTTPGATPCAAKKANSWSSVIARASGTWMWSQSVWPSGTATVSTSMYMSGSNRCPDSIFLHGAGSESEIIGPGSARLAKRLRRPAMDSGAAVSCLYSSRHTKPVAIAVVVAMAGMMRPALSLAANLSISSMP